jgi:hypothetical protein
MAEQEELAGQQGKLLSFPDRDAHDPIRVTFALERKRSHVGLVWEITGTLGTEDDPDFARKNVNKEFTLAAPDYQVNIVIKNGSGEFYGRPRTWRSKE